MSPQTGGQIGGPGGPIKRGLWLFMCACIILAVWAAFMDDPSQFWPTMYEKSGELADTVRGWVHDVGLTTDGTAPNIGPGK